MSLPTLSCDSNGQTEQQFIVNMLREQGLTLPVGRTSHAFDRWTRLLLDA